MNIEHVSMTDTPEQIREANAHFGMESEVIPEPTEEATQQGSEEAESGEVEPPAVQAEPAAGETTEEETTPAGEGETAEPQAGPTKTQEQNKGKKGTPPGVQKRFDELTAEREAAKENARRAEEEAKRDREALAAAQAELARLKKVGEPEPKPKVEEAAPTEPVVEKKPKPKRADFFEAEDPDEAYLDAVATWHAENQTAEVRAELARVQSQLETERNQRAEAAEAEKWNARKAQVIQDLPDFEETMIGENAPAAKVEINDVIREVMLDGSSQPEHIAYWLAKNPEQAKQIAAETVVYVDPNDPAKPDPRSQRKADMAAARWLARIEADMGLRGTVAPPAVQPPPVATPQPPAPASTQPLRPKQAPLPAPVKPLGSGGSGSGTSTGRKLADIKDPTEFRKAYEAGVR